MPTYYYVATFEADGPGEADEVANGRDLDPPTELPTVDELRDRIAIELSALADEIKFARTHLTAEVALRRRTGRVLEIVTLGGVSADRGQDDFDQAHGVDSAWLAGHGSDERPWRP